MRDEELIAAMRDLSAGPSSYLQDMGNDAADRIEALVKERDEALEWLSASQGYIADAVFALDKQEKAEARAERLEAALRLLHDNVVLAFPTLADLGPVANARVALIKEPTEYERKVAQMREDFPNGI